MARKAAKSEIVAFKVEQDLADFLNLLPNKSEFIRKAIIAQFGMTCPLCTGTGVVSRGLHTHFTPILSNNLDRPCDRCHTMDAVPLSLEKVADKDRERYEQFFKGGAFYCAKCYTEVPPCDDCGWHVPLESIAEHHRKLHSH